VSDQPETHEGVYEAPQVEDLGSVENFTAGDTYSIVGTTTLDGNP
jgi:hypothetical protein